MTRQRSASAWLFPGRDQHPPASARIRESLLNIVSEQYTHSVGVDTHARTHTYAVMASVTGQVTGTATFPASPRASPVP